MANTDFCYRHILRRQWTPSKKASMTGSRTAHRDSRIIATSVSGARPSSPRRSILARETTWITRGNSATSTTHLSISSRWAASNREEQYVSLFQLFNVHRSRVRKSEKNILSRYRTLATVFCATLGQTRDREINPPKQLRVGRNDDRTQTHQERTDCGRQ